MENKQRITILSAKPYKVNGNNGEVYEGYSFQMIQSDGLKPNEEKDGFKGYNAVKASMTSDFKNDLKAVPGVYDANVVFAQSNNGAKLKIQGLSFVRDLTAAQGRVN